MTADTPVAEEKDKNNIKFIPGETNILLIAPHGHPKDDIDTGKLTRLFAEDNGCYAIVNEVYGRKADAPHNINLNSLSDVKEHLLNEFLTPLLEYKKKVSEHGNPLIFWIHGAKKSNIMRDIPKGEGVNPGDIHVLVGYGQDSQEQRHTAKIETVEKFINALNQAGLNAEPANDTIRQKIKEEKAEEGQISYCGWANDNMNQLFRAGENMDPDVQSIQLEFRKLGCRDSDENIKKTTEMLSQAISVLIQPEIKSALTDDPLVLKAYDKIGRAHV